MSFKTTYHANGKLLLTGEYLVLHDAKAIALPLNVGQRLTVSEGNAFDTIRWQAFYKGNVWFVCELNPENFSVLKTNDPKKAQTLSRIFRTIKSLNPEFEFKVGTTLETILDSDPEWGLGSSSTLISLLSQWAGVNSFILNERIFKGSGFDIACATAGRPIFYTKNKSVQPINLNYPFADQLFLVYSGRKKKTANEVNDFLKEKQVSIPLIAEVTALSDEFATCSNQEEFNRLIRIHEHLIGNLIGKAEVKSAYFADFEGEIKSLGAWGGDFYLISTNLSFLGVKKYFESKGVTTIFRWNDLILKREQP